MVTKLAVDGRVEPPDDLETLLAAARVSAYWARFDEARDVLDRAVGIFGARPEIQARRVALARKAGDLALRREYLETAGEAVRRCFPLWREAVRLAIDTGEYDVAQALLQSPPAAADDTQRARESLLSGQFDEAKGNYSEALGHFRRTLQLDPHAHFQVHVEMARTALMSLDFELAREQMTRVLDVQFLPSAAPGNDRRFSRSRIAAEIGQLLDELLLDEALGARLAAIGQGARDRTIAELRALAADYPAHTLPAIRLLLTLRRRGELRDRPATTGAAPRLGAIPKRIVQYWDGSPPPPDVAAVMRSWIDLNPDWDYRLFDDAGAVEFLRGIGRRDACSAYLGATHAAQRADIFRLAYLGAEGGLYADADDRCLEPLSRWMPAEASFVGYLELCGAVGNDCLAAAPRHPALLLALAGAIEAVDQGENQLIWQSTGPGLLTRAFARAATAAPDLLEESVLLDLGALGRSVAIHCHLAYKTTDRHWTRAGEAV